MAKHGEVDPPLREKYEEIVRFLHALADDRDSHEPECDSIPMCVGEIGMRAASAAIYARQVTPLLLALTGASEISRLRRELTAATNERIAATAMLRDAGLALESAEARHEQETDALHAQVSVLEADLGTALAELTAYEESAGEVTE